ncbi:hypothetical protein [Terrisporobacter sp.]|uniref:hypothetical protein n=1 Tax=Terrisporobacter sp. TaxID=1965305 RepID=UPI0028A2AE52|nr:hypothetical protein [Terrisporobacter sp.]
MKKIINGVTIEKENNYCDVYDNDFQYYDGECANDCTHEDIYNSLKGYMEECKDNYNK